jgi:hypothetical protein
MLFRKHFTFGTIVKMTEGVHFVFGLTHDLLWSATLLEWAGMYKQTSKDKPERKVSIKYRCEQKMGTKKS